MKRKKPALVVIVIVGLVAIGNLAYQSLNDDHDERSKSSTSTITQAPSPSPEATTPASPSATKEIPPYDRDQFGQRWADVDRNGCDTRNDILGRDLLDIEFKPGTRGCVVLTGTLIDPYSGETVPFVRGEKSSTLVPIDHLISLNSAWGWGAWDWSDELRLEFANDPLNLAATTLATNGSGGKSDLPPSQWMPSDPSGKCRFAGNFLTLAEKYPLTIPKKEIQTVETALHACPSYTQQ